MEPLEGRHLLAAALQVTTLNDEVDNLDGQNTISLENFGGPNDLSLREAIQLASLEPESVTEIGFEPGLSGAIYMGLLGELVLRGKLTIDGDTDGDGKADIDLSGQIAGHRVIRITDPGTDVTLRSVRISGGDEYGAELGGGILVINDAEATVVDSTISGNLGGGISNLGATLTVINSLIYQNGTLGVRGSAIYSDTNLIPIGEPGSQSTTIIGTTIGNPDWVGPADVVNVDGFMQILNSTLTSPETGLPFAPLTSAGSATTRTEVGSTIVDGRVPAIELGGGAPDSFVSLGHNLFSSVATQVDAFQEGLLGDQIDDPLVLPLADNGGPTQTRLPASNSPALDSGSNILGLRTDARGFQRVFDSTGIPNGSGGAIDVGATEQFSSPPIRETLRINSLSLSERLLTEGQSTSLFVQFLPASDADTHFIDIDWNGDGVDDETHVATETNAEFVFTFFSDDEFNEVPITSADVTVRVRNQLGEEAIATTSFSLDQGDDAYSETGTWRDSSVPGQDGGVTRVSLDPAAFATWSPSLRPGRYRVLFYNTVFRNGTDSASVQIEHRGVRETFTLNQRSGDSGMVDLGVFDFRGDGSEFVRLLNASGAGALRADSVRFAAVDAIQLHVDDPGYAETGNWRDSSLAGLNGEPTRVSLSGDASATWQLPEFPAGSYSVEVYSPRFVDSTSIGFEIGYGDEIESFVVASPNPEADFVPLGIYDFSGSGEEFIRISRAISPEGFLRADAIRLVPLNLTVENVAPEITGFDVRPDALDPTRVDLALTFTDIGLDDEHTATIDWGDGTIETIAESKIPFSVIRASHHYDSGQARAAASNIRVTIMDDDGGIATIASTFLDQDVLHYRESGAWQDSAIPGFAGQPSRVSLEPDATASWDLSTVEPGWYRILLYNVTHRSGTDLAAASVDRLRLFNQASGPSAFVDLGEFQLNGNFGESLVLTNFVREGLLRTSALQLIPLVGYEPNESPASLDASVSPVVDADGMVLLAGSFVDSDPLDTHVVSIDWGDGNFESVELEVGARDFEIRHTYAEDANDGLVLPTVGVFDGTDVIGLFTYVVESALPLNPNFFPSYTESGNWRTSSLPGIRGSASRTSLDPEASATWRFPLPTRPDGYRILFANVIAPNSTPEATIEVSHQGNIETFTTSQQPGAEGLIDLGVYQFAASDSVRLTNSAGEGYLRANEVWFAPLSVITTRPEVVQSGAAFAKADVNRDERVSPLDALAVINFLAGEREARTYNEQLDSNSDGTNSPTDALVIINQLAAQPQASVGAMFLSELNQDEDDDDLLSTAVLASPLSELTD